MTGSRVVCCALLIAVTVAGCGPSAPDYKSIWTTTASAAPPTTDDQVSISSYFDGIGVTGAPVAPDKITDLTVTVPSPPGWAPYVNANLAPGTRTIAKGNTYPTAMLLVFQLDGKFDPVEALKHANADAEKSQNFVRLNNSNDNFLGLPSSMIEGSYDLNGQRMQSYNRIVIATGTPARPNVPGLKYLIQLTVTAFADKAQVDGPDIEAIIEGFTVRAK